MRQLVELQKNADDFKKLNAELIFVFREEREPEKGLKAILKNVEEKNRENFILGLDRDKKSSFAYSPKPRTFDNYVIDASGKVRAVIDGTLRTRAKAEQLLKVLKEIEADKK